MILGHGVGMFCFRVLPAGWINCKLFQTIKIYTDRIYLANKHKTYLSDLRRKCGLFAVREGHPDNRFRGESDTGQRQRSCLLPSNTTFYYTPLVSFYKDDMLPFLLRLSSHSVYNYSLCPEWYKVFKWRLLKPQICTVTTDTSVGVVFLFSWHFATDCAGIWICGLRLLPLYWLPCFKVL
jgi:hypothetical protein